MISILPNMRWICLPSPSLGEDWKGLSNIIDAAVDANGFELSEESVYLRFSHTPEGVLEGLGECLVARPVIGPKKRFEGHLTLQDWAAKPVWRESVQGKTLTDLLEEAFLARKKAQQSLPNLKEPFTLCVHRRLIPELLIQTEVFFNE
ncbi:MAG TPA: hypothetical protein VNJ01_07175 [Bacteriovoracaceae bacterium]|nr:hypothetical protein [Bacteriovoracaceae bacterium]